MPSPLRTVLAAAGLTGALHLLFVGADLWPDEAGYLEVAGHWHTTGPWLYGTFWVDRPPGLLVLFKAADSLGAQGVHLMACLASATLVLGAGWAGWAARGDGAARWSALVAAALAGSALIGATELDGELLAAPLVMVSVAALLQALKLPHRPALQGVLCVGAGATAVYALLVKQNFIDAIVFGCVLLVMRARGSRGSRAASLRVGGAYALGMVAVTTGLAAWALQHDRLGALVYAMYGFRVDAMAVIDASPLHPSGLRLGELLALALLGGPLYLAAGLLVVLRRKVREGRSLPLAIGASLAAEVVGVALGASYWPHYLVQLVPMLALGCGVACVRDDRAAAWLRRMCAFAAAVTLLSTPIVAAAQALQGNDATRVGSWVGRSAARGDSLVVTYSHPNVLEASGLPSAYPYMWSLPVRTLDPRLHRLRRLVAGRRAPAWIVEWDEFDAWRLDPEHRLARQVHARYRLVRTVCGRPVWLRADLRRSPVPAPPECDAAAGE